MAIAGPKIQVPANVTLLDQYTAIRPDWQSFFHAVQQQSFNASRSGPTASRPTSSLDGRYIGMPYFDTTISQPVFLSSVNPDVWVTWTAVGTLAKVATSGAYSDLSGLPALKAVATSGVYSDLTGLPALKAVATSGVYSDLTGLPALKAVATSGLYSDLSGLPSLQAVATSGSYADLTGYPSLTSFASTFAGATVALGANVFSTGPSLTLGAGSWFVSGTILVGSNVATSVRFTVKLTDGTNNFVSGQESIPAVTSTYCSIALSSLVVLGGSSTISMQAAADVAGCFIRGRPWQNNAGSTATYLAALRFD